MGRTSRPRVWPGGMPRRSDVDFERQLVGRCATVVGSRELPLVHVTASWPAQEILKKKKLLPSKCPIFQVELLYFFVLRPAYKDKLGREPSHQVSRFPFVFAVRPEGVDPPRHVYPFDTGAAATGAFASQADKYVQLEDYALENSHRAIRSFIKWAFGSIESYFDAELRLDVREDVAASESVVISYLDIARMGFEGSNRHDTRASTIEVASDHAVSLDFACLLIYPKQFLEANKTLVKIFKEMKGKGVSLRGYDWQPNRSPDEFQKDIMSISKAWFKSNGYLS